MATSSRKGWLPRIARSHWGLGVTCIVLLSLLTLALVPLAVRAAAPAQREIAVTAKSFAYDPPVIRVNQGDRVVFKLTSVDVVHGFYLDAYEVNEYVLPGQMDSHFSTPCSDKLLA